MPARAAPTRPSPICFASALPLFLKSSAPLSLSPSPSPSPSPSLPRTALRRRARLVACSPSPAEESIAFYGAPDRLPDTSSAVPSSAPSFATLPLFPLPLVLTPGATVPLHIFEMRYREMFNTIKEGDGMFGLVFYDSAKGFTTVGCAAELQRFEPMPDGSGRIMTTSLGRRRFRVVNLIDEKPYKRAMVEYFDDGEIGTDEVGEVSDVENRVWQALLDVLRLSNKLYDKSLDLGMHIREIAPLKGDNREDVALAEKTKALVDKAGESGAVYAADMKRMQDFSFAVSQVIDMPVEKQQLLLQTRSTLDRLRQQSEILDTARQYLAAQVTIKDAGLTF